MPFIQKAAHPEPTPTASFLELLLGQYSPALTPQGQVPDNSPQRPHSLMELFKLANPKPVYAALPIPSH